MIVRQGFTTGLAAQTRAIKDLRDIVRTQSQIAITGLEVQRPSDAAGQWQGLQRLEDLLRDQEVYMDNAGRAQGSLSVAEDALAQAANLLKEAREIAVQLSTGTATDEDRAGMVGRVDGIRAELIGLANTEFGGRSVFGGTAFDREAYSQAGVYQGDTGTSAIVVGDGQTVQTSFVGNALFDDGMFALEDLSAALASGAGSADLVASQLPTLDVALDQVVRGRQQIGFEVLDAEDAYTLADSLQLSLQDSVNERLAADPVEALTELSESQSTYEVALQVTAAVSSTNLFDFLR